MSNTSILRQVALVSYGTRFLQGHCGLEEWHRHDLLADTRFQFRALPGNALLADDFTWWLGILKLSGATRLSLHLAAEFQVQLPHVWRGSDYAIVVHHADHHEIWAVGGEHARWLDHPLVTEEARYAYPVFPDAASYSNEIDSYWHIHSRPGTMAVADTDWNKLAMAIAADLAIAVPSSLAPAGPFILPMGSPQERLPLFPFTPDAAKAHHIAATLQREQSSFANEMNPKNENTYHQRMDEEVHRWGERLDSWMTEVLLRCANDVGSAAGKGQAFQPRIHMTAPARPSPETAQITTPPTAPSDATSPLPSASRWTNRFVLFFMIAVFTVFFVALANVIAIWPWLAILIGLPSALYVSSRK